MTTHNVSKVHDGLAAAEEIDNRILTITTKERP